MQYQSRRFAVFMTVCGLLAIVLSIATVNAVDAHPRGIFELTNSIPTEDSVYRTRISPDGTLLAALTPATITLRSTVDASIVRTFTDVGMFAFSPNGQLLATGTWSGDAHTIRIWNVSDGQLLQTLLLPQTYALDVTFTPDGQQLLAASGTQIIAWQTSDWSLIWNVQGDDRAVRTVVVSPNGQTFATTTESAQVKLWRASDAQLLYTFPNQNYGGDSIAYSPDSQFLATADLNTENSYSTVSIWNVSTGRLAGRTRFTTQGVSSIAFEPSGDLLAVGMVEGPIKVLRVGTHKVVQTLTGHANGVNSLLFSSDGQTLYSGGSDSVIKVWSQVQ